MKMKNLFNAMTEDEKDTMFLLCQEHEKQAIKKVAIRIKLNEEEKELCSHGNIDLAAATIQDRTNLKPMVCKTAVDIYMGWVI